MTIAAVHQPQYLPYLGFFHKFTHCDIFVALDHVQFIKSGFEHRNRIKTEQGWRWITVPVRHPFEIPIREVQIDSSTGWASKHWNVLKSNYLHTPFFGAYAADLHPLFKQKYEGLCGLDMALLSWVAEVLGLRTPIVYSSGLGIDTTKSEMLIEICKKIGSERYLSGPGGRNYMDLDIFEQAGIQVEFQEFKHPVYEQRFPQLGFIENLSVLDALFCCGDAAVREMLV